MGWVRDTNYELYFIHKNWEDWSRFDGIGFKLPPFGECETADEYKQKCTESLQLYVANDVTAGFTDHGLQRIDAKWENAHG